MFFKYIEVLRTKILHAFPGNLLKNEDKTSSYLSHKVFFSETMGHSSN